MVGVVVVGLVGRNVSGQFKLLTRRRCPVRTLVRRIDIRSAALSSFAAAAQCTLFSPNSADAGANPCRSVGHGRRAAEVGMRSAKAVSVWFPELLRQEKPSQKAFVIGASN